MKLIARIAGGLLLAVLAIAIAGWLLLRRGDIPYETLETKYASAASRYMDLPDGLRVHYRDEGRRDGHVLVLVHGFSASVHAWEPWVQRLGADYRIITLDLPGHGLTRAPKGYVLAPDGFVQVVDQVTARLGVTKFVLGGNSMGGGVTWQYALAHPEKVEGLVLVDAAGWPHAPQKGGAVVFSVMRNPVGRALLKDLDGKPLIKQGLEAAYLDQKLVTPALVDRYADLARAPGHRDILFAMQTGRRQPATEAAMATIKVPVLVMHGRQDRLIPFADGEHFAHAIPGAQLAAYDNVGHVPMEQIPDRSAADLKTWLTAKVWP